MENWQQEKSLIFGPEQGMIFIVILIFTLAFAQDAMNASLLRRLPLNVVCRGVLNRMARLLRAIYLSGFHPLISCSFWYNGSSISMVKKIVTTALGS